MVATGKQVNMQPELQFQLTVDVNGSQSEVTHTQVVSPAVIGQLQPGANVPVKVDPNDHSKLMIGLGVAARAGARPGIAPTIRSEGP